MKKASKPAPKMAEDEDMTVDIEKFMEELATMLPNDRNGVQYEVFWRRIGLKINSKGK